VVSIFTTFFIFTSYPAFIHSLTAGSVYPFFIIGMICLGVLLLALAGLYGWYRFLRTEPEGFGPKKKKDGPAVPMALKK
jgi:hypothetical protein